MSFRLTRIVAACALCTMLGPSIAAAQTAPSPAPDATPAMAQPSPAPDASPAMSMPAPAASAPAASGPAATNDRAGGAPAPAALATPGPGWDPLKIKGLTFSGLLRAYDFSRLNTPEYNVKGAATGPNRTAFNFGGDVRADYKIGDTPFAVGGAFWGAYPFGANGGFVGCNVGAGLIVNEPQALCSKNNAGIDNSLPGYPLETFEYYVKFNNPVAAITVGNQLINKIWMPASDSRIKPSLYQGLDATFNLDKMLALGVTVVTRFEDRSESLFDQCTLLTCTTTPAAVGSGGVFKTTTPITTGADRIALAFKPSSRATVNVEDYLFHNIANLTYVDGRYLVKPAVAANPFVAAQFVEERNTGTSIVGKVLNQTVGLQLGGTPAKHLLFTLGSNFTPWNYDVVRASSASAAVAPYFLPSGGTDQIISKGVNASATPAIELSPGVYKVAYGGIASPYTDSYTSDPLYTTSISQGMVERRGGGFAVKAALTYTTENKRLVALASEAAYNYDTNFVRNRTYEFDTDVTYNFNTVRSGTYKGLSFRERFADRTQPTLPLHFLYLRHQLQYSF